ncbi:hypothetical protein OAU50_04355 [Planctomycetota bacterium]|nr:hypothetical protein [Planctomycetota bacterium]
MTSTYLDKLKGLGFEIEWCDLLAGWQGPFGGAGIVSVQQVASFAQDQLATDDSPETMALAIMEKSDDMEFEALTALAQPKKNMDGALKKAFVILLGEVSSDARERWRRVVQSENRLVPASIYEDDAYWEIHDDMHDFLFAVGECEHWPQRFYSFPDDWSYGDIEEDCASLDRMRASLIESLKV